MSHSASIKEPTRHVPLFVVFDLDRTLIDTNAFVEVIWRALPKLGMPGRDIEALKEEELSRRGEQFDLISEIAERVSKSHSKEQLAALLVEAAESWTIVYGEVAGLLGDLKQYDVPMAIMTYGGELSQQIKLQILAEDLKDEHLMPPVLIVDHNEKAKWIDQNATIAREGGRIVPFELSGGDTIIADKIVIIDDKQPNLDVDADDIEGILIDNQSSSHEYGIKIGELTISQLLRHGVS